MSPVVQASDRRQVQIQDHKQLWEAWLSVHSCGYRVSVCVFIQQWKPVMRVGLAACRWTSQGWVQMSLVAQASDGRWGQIWAHKLLGGLGY